MHTKAILSRFDEGEFDQMSDYWAIASMSSSAMHFIIAQPETAQGACWFGAVPLQRRHADSDATSIGRPGLDDVVGCHPSTPASVRGTQAGPNLLRSLHG